MAVLMGNDADLRYRVTPEECGEHRSLGALSDSALLRHAGEGDREPDTLHICSEGCEEAGEHDLIARLQAGPVLPNAPPEPITGGRSPLHAASVTLHLLWDREFGYESVFNFIFGR